MTPTRSQWPHWVVLVASINVEARAVEEPCLNDTQGQAYATTVRMSAGLLPTSDAPQRLTGDAR